MDLTTVVTLALIVAALVLMTLLGFVVREVGRTRGFFRVQAQRLGGTTTGLPVGMVFELQGIRVRVYALQGSIHYHARVKLREDPGILVTRTYPGFRFLDALQYSPGRRKFRFNGPVDDLYGFRATNTDWLRVVFDSDVLQRMTAEARINRFEVRRRGVRGAFWLANHSEEELSRASQSLDLLNHLVTQIAKSSLAEPGQQTSSG